MHHFMNKFRKFIGSLGCRLIRVGYPNAFVIINARWNRVLPIPDLRQELEDTLVDMRRTPLITNTESGRTDLT